MVTKITMPTAIKRALNYNEQKVKEGNAECLYAHRFLKEADRLNFYDKLLRFENLIALNQRATTNTVHISLNFGPDEKIEKEKLIEIASVYMEKIGFNDQPYLVYRHTDAGHPHIHIISTNIRQDGKRISLHNIGRKESTKARREIEVKFNLVKAEDQKKRTPIEIQPAQHQIKAGHPTPESGTKPAIAQKLRYGKAPTKRAITHVLDAILPHYKYASLHELNAVLRLYNLKADRGKEDGIIYRKKGLLYRVLDDNGNYIGVPIKASSIYNRPTLNFLEQRFEVNERLKAPFKKQIKAKLDWILIRHLDTLQRFKEALEKENISLSIRENEKGVVYGLTYIDHSSKTVFNGSDIGKRYSANGILENLSKPFRLEQPVKSLKAKRRSDVAKEPHLPTARAQHQDKRPDVNQLQQPKTQTILSRTWELLATPEVNHEYIPFELRKSKKKKRKTK